ncbi:TolC family protein [Flammeovirga kamogawensis]|uniref:TolC family protein n=1 Tax=Flammeovirga kamogawensis TaxID=373891 RepID=A0ABX8GWP5_9BACT|nr:TolC family protein [Flammeovirga kamogawensis]MBB6461178.1 outer membrane protein TolC [Flammeovirga kamogawensis]QWG07742.1 TolC family protein [Flammeovirga kamogawensis]TRX69548.1 TolC family protein [Flammeovirga kamogawensis]
MNKVNSRYLYLLLLVFGFSFPLIAQTKITFEQAEKEALEKHPLSEQKEMYSRMQETEKEAISKDRLPQFGIQGKIGYFSDVISPTDPNAPAAAVFPEIPHTQWQTYASVDYAIYNGNIKKKKLAQSSSEYGIKIQENSVKQFSVKESISQIYFAALSYQEQEALIKDGVIKELENQLKEVEALEAGGAALPSTTDALKVEYFKAQQKLLSVEAQKNGALKALCIWLERENEWNTIELVRPEMTVSLSADYNRPEVEMYKLQTQSMDVMSDMLKTQRLPVVSAYAIGGYGTPNPYNFFLVDGDFFYQVGLKFAWKPFDYGKNSRERQVTQIQKEVINTELETFSKTMNSQIVQIQASIDQLEKLITQDNEIIKIQERNAIRSKGQLDNGAATSAKYVSALNALTDAKLNLSSHELQLLQTQYHLAMTKGLL